MSPHGGWRGVAGDISTIGGPRADPRGGTVTIAELKELLEAEATHGAEALSRAKLRGDAQKIGYWTAYVEARERVILLLSSMAD